MSSSEIRRRPPNADSSHILLVTLINDIYFHRPLTHDTGKAICLLAKSSCISPNAFPGIYHHNIPNNPTYINFFFVDEYNIYKLYHKCIGGVTILLDLLLF